MAPIKAGTALAGGETVSQERYLIQNVFYVGIRAVGVGCRCGILVDSQSARK